LRSNRYFTFTKLICFYKSKHQTHVVFRGFIRYTTALFSFWLTLVAFLTLRKSFNKLRRDRIMLLFSI
jgi:hypothetical protein